MALPVPEPVEPDPNCPSCAVLRKQVAELTKLVKQLQRTVDKQAKEIANLKSRVKPTSRNFSTPPSQDPHRARESKPRSNRKQGGQPGHQGKGRKLSPPDEVNTAPLENCGNCGLPLVVDDPSPYRHQIFDIPDPKVYVTEWRLPKATCTGCGHTTRAKLPDGVPRSQFGPNICATIPMMSGRFKLSKRETQQCMADIHGVEISLGSVSNIEGRVSEELAPAQNEALEDGQAADVKYADETTWRVKGESAYLWLVATVTTVVCLIRPTRSSEAAKELLGDTPTGTVVTDRYGGYGFVPEQQRQVCGAHLRRDFVKMAEGEKEFSWIGESLLTLTDAMFEKWHSFREGNIERGELARHCQEIRQEMFALLDEGQRSIGGRTPSMCRGILRTEEPMWTFVDVPGVEPTNNDAERAVRPAVLYRKSCFGTQSDRGSRFVERMQTVTGTLARRKQQLFPFIKQAAKASLGLGDAPSLRA